MKKFVSKIFKGLNLDSDKKYQPEGTYSFALNTVINSSDGETVNLINENGTIENAIIPDDYIILSTIYISKTEIGLFLVKKDESDCEIGVIKNNTYTTYVKANLNFKLKNPINATYRLRNGCERVIYFVDGLNKPRIINLDSLRDYKQNFYNLPADFDDVSKYWDIDKFNLFRDYNTIPVVSKTTVRQSGNLYPGSYTFSIQYLDEDLNPTEFISHTQPVIIYNDSLTKDYSHIRGSTNKESAYQSFGITNKSIKLDIDFIDVSFPYYRIGIVEYTNGSGEISRVVTSNKISTNIKQFEYTGTNFSAITTIEELQNYSLKIASAKYIEQLENRLILGNTKDKQVNYGKLQKYASRVKSDVVFRTIELDSIASAGNPKRGEVRNEYVGYTPGEIYSFGIQYIFADGEISPAYHIPGKNPSCPSSMSNDNKCSNSFYLNPKNCNEYNFWGVDSQGDPLEGTNIRHHRFPLRSEIDKPLLNGVGDLEETVSYRLYINLTSAIRDDYTDSVINYTINYTIDGTPFQSQKTLYVDSYNSNVDENGNVIGYSNIFIDSSLSSNIILVSVEERDSNGILLSPSSGIVYTEEVKEATSIYDNTDYNTDIFGIEFSNIEIPSIEDSGVPIVGYYIVRNERTENEKTILDSAILTPLLESSEGNFLAHGHLFPTLTSNRKLDTYALIHPNHKFNNIEYQNIDEIIHEGSFYRESGVQFNTVIEDVQPGTSYDPSINKKRDKDSDGYSLNNGIRTNTLTYTVENGLKIADSFSETINTFYLDALYSNKITDSLGNPKEVYNVSADNKIGIISFEENKFEDSYLQDYLPYVILKKRNSEPYSNFRVLPYYREHNSPVLATNGEISNTTVFNGDSYVSSMKYTSSMFYDIAISERAQRTKKGILNYVIGVLAIIGGVVITGLSFGLAAPLGIAAIGFGVTQIATGIKKSQMSKVYGDLWEKGLDETVQDGSTLMLFPTPEDDEIQWFYDICSNFWFESSINMNWRMGSTIGLTDFLDSPKPIDQNEIETYLLDKVTTMDNEANGGRSYQGYAKAELYEINKDYQVNSVNKIFFHLPEEYDYCSNCIEEFPHRVYYSEQSFQEEQTDNYRVFLPNNYKDIEGDTGVITNLFRIQNNLYIHTEEALWHLPQNIQERVTGDITSFIGTGSFFEIPPRKILDEKSGNSAGCTHSLATIKTSQGMFFVSEKEGVVYLFNGNNLIPISGDGMYNWFKENLAVKFDKDFFRLNSFNHDYTNNTSSSLGTGYVSTYDNRNQRFILTKKDFTEEYLNSLEDYNICETNGKTIIFENFSQIIQEQLDLGWYFTGIENCELQFEKEATETRSVDKIEVIPNDADIIVHMDMTVSFNNTSRSQIRDAVLSWRNSYTSINPLWNGKVYFFEYPFEGLPTPQNVYSERWLNILKFIEDNQYFYEYDEFGISTPVSTNIISNNIIAVSFVNEAAPLGFANEIYHAVGTFPVIPSPGPLFNTDYNNFVSRYNTRINSGGSFKGLLYPIIYAPGDYFVNPGLTGDDIFEQTYGYLQHLFGALKGVPYTPEEVSVINLDPNTFCTEWNVIMSSLTEANPYPDNGLENYNWSAKLTVGYDGTNDVITSTQFQNDMQEFLEGTINIVQEDVEFPITIYKTIQGTEIDLSKIDNSWTLSYSLINKSWISFHSYLPNVYFNQNQDFYSWRLNDNTIWKHNNKDNFNNFYNQKEKFILEYVSIDNNLETKMFDSVKFSTEAYRFDPLSEDFVRVKDVTFNKGIFYNTSQSTGEVGLLPKDTTDDYLKNQIKTQGQILKLDNNQNEWDLNELRDYTIDKNVTLFLKNKSQLQAQYFIDKIVNDANINYNKPWFEIEPLKDKYLVIRLIFDTFDDIKLIFSNSVEEENVSIQ